MMVQKKKQAKLRSWMPFFFQEKKNQKGKDDNIMFELQLDLWFGSSR